MINILVSDPNYFEKRIWDPNNKLDENIDIDAKIPGREQPLIILNRLGKTIAM